VWAAGVREASARSYRVLTTRPSESEVKLSFTGLIDLCQGIDDELLDGLPVPHRHALEVALLGVEAAGEGCQYSDPSRDGLVLVDEAAQELTPPKLHRGSVE
jgi:hypothetical protein